MRLRGIGTFVLLCTLIAAGFLAGAWATWRASSPPASTPRVLYWVDPMHPSYKSDKPGIAPDCGMQLEPVYADDVSPSPGSTIPASALRISPERQQTIGITTGVAERTALRRSLRTVGRVAADENRVYRLAATIDGWVNQVLAGQTGAIVAKDQPLLYFYSREFLSAQAAYFYALETRERFKAASQDTPAQMTLIDNQIRTAAETLRGLGMDDLQLAEIAKSRQAATDIVLRSPTTGYIVARNVYPRQRFDRGTELYRIVDVSHVWILADLFESDAQYIRPGSTARVSFPYQQQGPIDARAGDALPQFDPATRTFKLRLEADNPAYTLRPDMLVDVELGIALPEALTVPSDAVVDSGGHKTVFIDRANGYFEPRRVTTGWRFDGRVEILKGLMPGDRIALAGNFLLDSESRMKSAAMGISVPEVDPVCGMDIDGGQSKVAGRTTEHHGQTYYFCSDDCKRRFDAAPAKYADETESPSSARPWAVPPTRVPSPAPAPGRTSDAGIREGGVPTAPAGRGMSRSFRPRVLPAGSAGQPLSPPSGTADAGGDRNDLPPVAMPTPLAPGTIADPVVGLPVEIAAAVAAKLTFEYKGRTHYFASIETKALFEQEPDLYLSREGSAPPGAMPPELPPSAGREVRDPVCGMRVDAQAATAAGRKSDYKGTTYSFCSDDCKEKFAKDPARYVTDKEAAGISAPPGAPA